MSTAEMVNSNPKDVQNRRGEVHVVVSRSRLLVTPLLAHYTLLTLLTYPIQ